MTAGLMLTIGMVMVKPNTTRKKAGQMIMHLSQQHPKHSGVAKETDHIPRPPEATAVPLADPSGTIHQTVHYQHRLPATALAKEKEKVKARAKAVSLIMVAKEKEKVKARASTEKEKEKAKDSASIAKVEKASGVSDQAKAFHRDEPTWASTARSTPTVTFVMNGTVMCEMNLMMINGLTGARMSTAHSFLQYPRLQQQEDFSSLLSP